MMNMVLISNGGLRPLHIIIKDMKLYANHVNILVHDSDLLYSEYYSEHIYYSE